MTGLDLVIYILKNNLLNQPIYDNGALLGFITADEAAVKFDVGPATIKVWVKEGRLDGIFIGDTVYIPAIAVKQMEEICSTS